MVSKPPPIPVPARAPVRGRRNPSSRRPGPFHANPPHRLAVGRERQDGAVVDDDLDGALVVLDAKVVVLDGIARLRVAVGAAKVEQMVFEESEHILG